MKQRHNSHRWKWSNTIIYASGNIGVVFLFFSALWDEFLNEWCWQGVLVQPLQQQHSIKFRKRSELRKQIRNPPCVSFASSWQLPPKFLGGYITTFYEWLLCFICENWLQEEFFVCCCRDFRNNSLTGINQQITDAATANNNVTLRYAQDSISSCNASSWQFSCVVMLCSGDHPGVATLPFRHPTIYFQYSNKIYKISLGL